MYYKISPSEALQGDVKIPGSKSGTARGLILGTLAGGTSHILNPMSRQLLHRGVLPCAGREGEYR